jgi:hypothetical protein
MPAPRPPHAPAGFLQVQVRSVDGSFVTLNLLATDYRIVLGKDRDYLIGSGATHAFSKDGRFIRSGRSPIMLSDLDETGQVTRVG